MMTPSQYKARYENIEVTLDDGQPANVTVNQYRLVPSNWAEAAKDAFVGMLRKRGIDTVLVVNAETGVVRVDPAVTRSEDILKKKIGKDVDLSKESGGNLVDTKITNWEALAVFAFMGKGSPEHCQIVLQLARHWKLAPDLQKYANDNLGLDCNGFVGNYLWHVRSGKSWNDIGRSDSDKDGPNMSIDGYFQGRRRVEDWGDIERSKSYLLGRVDENNGRIIPGGRSSEPGHITITEPNTRRENPSDSSSFAVKSVESTGSHTPGLSVNWYSLMEAKEIGRGRNAFVDRENDAERNWLG